MLNAAKPHTPNLDRSLGAPTTLHEYLKFCRERAGLDQHATADVLAVHVTTYRAWENKVNVPTLPPATLATAVDGDEAVMKELVSKALAARSERVRRAKLNKKYRQERKHKETKAKIKTTPTPPKPVVPKDFEIKEMLEVVMKIAQLPDAKRDIVINLVDQLSTSPKTGWE